MNISRAIIRRFTTTSVKYGGIHPGFCKIKQLQERFQKPDGKPIYLKAGTSDEVLYRLTIALTLVGIGDMAYCFYRLIFPPKPQD